MSTSPHRSFRWPLALLALVVGCNTASGHGDGAQSPFGAPSEEESLWGAPTEDMDTGGSTGGEDEDPGDAEAFPRLAARPSVAHARGDAPLPPAIAPLPIAARIARQPVTVHTAPDFDAPLRGRIPMGEAFSVFALVEGEHCGGQGWADLGDGGFACLERTRNAGKREPAMIPPMRGSGGLLPYYYAKVKKGVEAGRWRSLADLGAGRQHVDTLQAGHDYAFTYRKRHRGQIVLIDDRGRAVLESQVHAYRPSRFGGRDLAAKPIPEGRKLLWTVSWPETRVHAEPDPSSALTANLDYQVELLAEAEPVRNAHGTWYRLDEGGYVHEREVRVWSMGTQLADVGAGEIWLDVDLDQQTLTVVQGTQPVFATLVSSGFKGPTPQGIFRIHHKQAVGDMSSSPGESDFYSVQAVPFVQYFAGGIALHGAYWHYRFGHPVSHGCVNLSPKDARLVYGLTSPEPHEGWIQGYESEAHLGTTVRIRRGDRPVKDKRGAVEPVTVFVPKG